MHVVYCHLVYIPVLGSLRWQGFILYRNISDSNFKMLLQFVIPFMSYCNACRKYFETFLTIIRVIYPLIDHNNYLYSIQQMRECKRERYLFHQKLIYTNTNTNILSAQTQLQWYMSCIYVWIWLTAWVHIFHINGRLLIHVQLKYLKTIVFICYNYW